MKELQPGVYRHFKGGLYLLLGQACHSETMEKMVVYQALYGERGWWYGRPTCGWKRWNMTGKPFHASPILHRMKLLPGLS